MMNESLLVYVVHGHADRALANQARSHLDDCGLRNFISLDLDYPDDAEQTRETIEKCDVVIALCSKSFARSHNVFFEVATAWRAGKRIIPVLTADTTIADVHPILEGDKPVLSFPAFIQMPREAFDAFVG